MLLLGEGKENVAESLSENSKATARTSPRKKQKAGE